MKTFAVEGIVVRRQSIGEADRILTVFTKEKGKISIKATGVRRVPSKRAPHVELLNLSQLFLYKGKGMPMLTEAHTIESFPEVKNDLMRVGFAYHICELIDGLCPENQENKAVFELLSTTLFTLSRIENISSAIHTFEMSLLHLLGFYPQSENLAFDTTVFIEQILERRLKSRQFLHRFS